MISSLPIISARSRVFVWVVLAAGALSSACDKIPLLAPAESTITLSSAQRILALNGQAEITAVVMEPSGNPVQNGTSVRFTSSLGRVDPVETQTRNGVATATFLAGDTSGVAEVRASSGAAGGGAGATPTNSLSFTIGAAAADSVSIRTTPSAVPVTGGTVTVSATVIGTNGRPISGVPVTFGRDFGTLSSTSAVTDGNGEASVTLTTSVTTAVTATVIATTATGSSPKTATTTVTVLGTPSVTLTCTGGTASGTSCTQVSDQPVTFTASRGATTSVITNAELDFGDGTSVSLGTLTSPSTVTHTYTNNNSTPATYTATLRATDVNGQTTSASVALAITPRPTPPTFAVALTAAPDAVATTTGQRVSFTAVVTLGSGDPLLTQIESYSWDFGDGTFAETSSGSTAHVYGANSVPPATSATSTTYTATVTARSRDGRSATGRTEFQIRLAAPLP